VSIVALRCRTHNRGERRRPFHLLQISLDRDGKRVRRDLTEANDEVVKGAWEYTSRPFDAGLYCHHCLNEGQRSPLPIDEVDIRDLGLADPPLVFQSPRSFDSTTLIASLREKFGDRVRDVRELSAQPAVYADGAVLDRLHPGLRRAMVERLLPKDGNL